MTKPRQPRQPQIVETEGQVLEENGAPMIDIAAIIKAAQEQAPAIQGPEPEPKHAIHRLENEVVTAGKLIADAVISDQGVERLAAAVLGGFFK